MNVISAKVTMSQEVSELIAINFKVTVRTLVKLIPFPEYSMLSPAHMWTRPDLKLFKQEVSAGKGDGVIKVGHGDVVTVRVPTHEGGSCLFWEFATDSYDIGFGVYFEWGKPVTNEVSVHISESDDDEDALEDEGNEGLTDIFVCHFLNSFVLRYQKSHLRMISSRDQQQKV